MSNPVQPLLSLYETINRLDQRLLYRIFVGHAQHDPELDNLVSELYRLWLELGETSLRDIDDIPETLRSAIAEIKGLLTPSTLH